MPKASGEWRTINGNHVLIGADGTIQKGPRSLMGARVTTAKKSSAKKSTSTKKTASGSSSAKKSTKKSTASTTKKSTSTKKSTTPKTTKNDRVNWASDFYAKQVVNDGWSDKDIKGYAETMLNQGLGKNWTKKDKEVFVQDFYNNVSKYKKSGKKPVMFRM